MEHFGCRFICQIICRLGYIIDFIYLSLRLMFSRGIISGFIVEIRLTSLFHSFYNGITDRSGNLAYRMRVGSTRRAISRFVTTLFVEGNDLIVLWTSESAKPSFRIALTLYSFFI